MATSSLNQTNHYTIKEFQLLVKDAPVVSAEIQPFVGVSFRSSADIYRLFKGLSLHDGRNLPGCRSSARMGQFGFQVKRQLEPVLIGLV